MPHNWQWNRHFLNDYQSWSRCICRASSLAASEKVLKDRVLIDHGWSMRKPTQCFSLLLCWFEGNVSLPHFYTYGRANFKNCCLKPLSQTSSQPTSQNIVRCQRLMAKIQHQRWLDAWGTRTTKDPMWEDALETQAEGNYFYCCGLSSRF